MADLPHPVLHGLVDAQENFDALVRAPNWQTPTLAANWTNPDTTEPVGYARSATGLVVLRGEVERDGSSWTLPETMFTLPSGYRPGAAEPIFQVPLLVGTTTVGWGRVRVLQTGDVSLRATSDAWAAGTNSVILSPVMFWAER